MSSDPTNPPPPPYPNAQTQSSTSDPPQYATNTSQSDTFPDEKSRGSNSQSVPSRMHIFYDKSLITEKREMYINIADTKTKVYHVAFSSVSTAARMRIQRGDERGPTIAQVIFPDKSQHIEIVFTDGEKVKIEDMAADRKRIAVELVVNAAPETFYWAGTEKYGHEHKGKGKMGDVELVDETGKVYAIFLNEWKASGVEENSVGKLELKQVGIDEKLTDQLVISLLALMERYQFMSGAKSRGVAEAVLVLEPMVLLASCIVS